MEKQNQQRNKRQTDIRNFFGNHQNNSYHNFQEIDKNFQDESQFDDDENKQWSHLCTDVIEVKNQSQFSVEVYSIDNQSLKKLEEKLLQNIPETQNNTIILDPKSKVKNIDLEQFIQNNQTLDSLKNLLKQALLLHLKNQANAKNNDDQEQQLILRLDQQAQKILEEQIQINQEQNQLFQLNQNSLEQFQQLFEQKQQISISERKSFDQINKVKHLYYNKKCSKMILMKRFKLTKRELENIITQNSNKLNQLKQQQAKNFKINTTFLEREIKNLFHIQKPILSSNQLNQILKEKYDFKLSNSYLSKIMKNFCKMNYKKIYKVDPRINNLECLVARHFAAKEYLNQLGLNKIIINIDESNIQYSNDIKKGWSFKGTKFYSSKNEKLYSISIIAAISSQGEVYYQLQKGFNNSKTVYYFIMGLIQLLENKDQNWREKTILMLDNATYHRSKFIQSKFRLLQISIMYLGPYQFDLAPIEKLFSYIKRNIKIEDQRLKVEQFLQIYSENIQKLNFQWIEQLFISTIQQTLKFIVFQKI